LGPVLTRTLGSVSPRQNPPFSLPAEPRATRSPRRVALSGVGRILKRRAFPETTNSSTQARDSVNLKIWEFGPDRRFVLDPALWSVILRSRNDSTGMP